MERFVQKSEAVSTTFEPVRENTDVDVVVVGAGFGGLATALTLAEAGVSVVLCESLKYPGGCAATFEHRGFRFEAGATLFSGFGEGALFERWIRRYDLGVEVEWLDPVLEVRSPRWRLAIPADRERWAETLGGLPGSEGRESRLRAFLRRQERVADCLWPLLDEPALLPPLTPAEALRHLPRLPRYAALAPDLGRDLGQVLKRFGLGEHRAFRTLVDALCQITVQCPADRADAIFTLATLDYFFRGTGHVRGGIGKLAHGLLRAVEAAGGRVLLAERVKSLRPASDSGKGAGGWTVVTRRRTIQARAVVVNRLPRDVLSMVETDAPGLETSRLAGEGKAVAASWGACMLYRRVRVPPGATGHDGPHHLQLIVDPDLPLNEGNLLFASLADPEELDDPARGNERSLTVSTHVDLPALLELDDAGRARRVEEIQQRMRRGLARLAPEWEDVTFETTASPRTFARFTGRHDGFVGGVPRHAGLKPYFRMLRPGKPPLPGLWTVGDSYFPGQSTLATAVGGVKTAERLLRGDILGP